MVLLSHHTYNMITINIPAVPNVVLSIKGTLRSNPIMIFCSCIQRGKLVVPMFPSTTEREELLRTIDTPAEW